MMEALGSSEVLVDT